MESTNLKDEGMSIKGLIGFFFIFIIVSCILPLIATLIFENVSSTAEKLASCIAEIITYLFLAKKLYKKYDLDLKLNFKINYKVYIWILFLWIGFMLTYDNSLGVIINKLAPDSWINEVMADEINYPISAFLGICIMAPIFEEVICRGYVLQRLSKRYSNNVAIVLSALFFGAIHMNAIQTPNAFIIGLVFGAIYLRTNSLIPCIFLHFINNTFCYITDYLPIYDADSFSYIKLASGVVILIICGYVYFKEKNSSKFSLEI